MLVNDQTVVTRDSIFAQPGYLYGYEISQNTVDWDQRQEQLHESKAIADRIFDLLGYLPRILGVSEKVTLRSSVTIPRRNPAKTMTALVSRDSIKGYFYSDTHIEFTWGVNPKGIAGYSARTQKPVLIPDIKNDLDKFKDVWVKPSTSVAGAIVAIPILAESKYNGPEDKECMAVLSVLSKKRSLINRGHLGCLKKLADDIQATLLESSIFPESRFLDVSVPKPYYRDMGKERGSQDDKFLSTDQILSEIISDLHEDGRRGKKPVKVEEILRKFRDAGEEGVPIESLHSDFQDSTELVHAISSFLGKLNNRYLKDQGLRIEGSVIYRIVKKSE